MTYLLTTSRRPSYRLRSFLKDLSSILPNAIHINRGKKTLEDLLYDAIEFKADRLIIVGERKGNPGKILIYEVDSKQEELRKLSMLILRGVKLSRENPNAIRVYNPQSIVLPILTLRNELEEEAADIISKALKIKLIHSDIEEYEVKPDIAMKIKYSEGEKYFILSFYNPSTRKSVGPLLKVGKIIDYRRAKSIP